MKRGYCTECESENVKISRFWKDGLGRERGECAVCNREINSTFQTKTAQTVQFPAVDQSDYMPEPVSDDGPEAAGETNSQNDQQDTCEIHGCGVLVGEFGPFCGMCADARRSKVRKDWRYW